MADAHGRLVVETNKVDVYVVIDICVFIYVQGNYLLNLTTQSKCHKMMFIFISYSAHFTGVRAESRAASCCGDRLLHYDFYIQLLFLHTTAIDETAVWISELSKFEHN